MLGRSTRLLEYLLDSWRLLVEYVMIVRCADILDAPGGHMCPILGYSWDRPCEVIV
jgi:hypothetical protein